MRLGRHRAAILSAAALAAVALAGCSTAPSPATSPRAAAKPPAFADLRSWERSTRDLADDLVAEARQLAEDGSVEEARSRLDEALCAVLDAPPGYEQRPAYLDYLAMLFAEVAALEDPPSLEPANEIVDLPELEERIEAHPDTANDSEPEGPPQPLDTRGMELVHNSTVESFVDAYTRPGKYRNRIEAGLLRAGRYLPMIRQELELRGLPPDLAFLPLIESAYSFSATSPARAHGMWQFIASTARLYGLRVDSLVDERRDPVLSTRAAVAHLADLHEEFGDWELALAAYNSGAGNVRRAIRATGSRDFWTLRRRLPRETRNYVPAFIAAVVVGRDPARFGLPRPAEERWELDAVEVDDALDLEVIADRLDLAREELLALNPAIRRSLTPAGARSTIWLPPGRGGEARAVLAAMPREEWAPRRLHTVRSGETLSAIARRHDTSADAIRAANGLSGSLIHPGQVLIVPRGPGSSPSGQRPVRETTADGHYVVRANDTPWDIARSFGLDLQSLLAANLLSADAVILPGQRLAIPTAAEPAPASGDSGAAPATYRVRSGDTLYGIARRFGTSVEELRSENHLRGSRILPGEVLRIPGGNGRG